MIELLIEVTAIALASTAFYLILHLTLLIQRQQQPTTGYKPGAQRLKELRENRIIEVDLPGRRSYKLVSSSTALLQPSRLSFPNYSAEPTRAVLATHRELETKLLSMLGGNRKTAVRLLAQIRQRHPNRDDQWCLEKIISDLERDRR